MIVVLGIVIWVFFEYNEGAPESPTRPSQIKPELEAGAYSQIRVDEIRSGFSVS